MRREKPGRESVGDAEKLRYPTLPAAEVHTLRIGEVQPDPYSDKEDDYVSLDLPLDISVSAARSSRNKSSGTSAKEPIKRILRKQIEKEDGYAAPKNVRLVNGDLKKMHHLRPRQYPFLSLVKIVSWQVLSRWENSMLSAETPKSSGGFERVCWSHYDHKAHFRPRSQFDSW